MSKKKKPENDEEKEQQPEKRQSKSESAATDKVVKVKKEPGVDGDDTHKGDKAAKKKKLYSSDKSSTSTSIGKKRKRSDQEKRSPKEKDKARREKEAEEAARAMANEPHYWVDLTELPRRGKGDSTRAKLRDGQFVGWMRRIRRAQEVIPERCANLLICIVISSTRFS